jgi:hypothetical protein
MNVAVCSFHFSGHQELADITVPNKVAYCERHGYTGVFDIREDWLPYDKFRLVRELLPDHDAVLWIDCDAIFANPTFRVEALIDHLEGQRALTITRDGKNGDVPSVNSGVFLMERCDAALAFLDMALSPTMYKMGTAVRHMNGDQPLINEWIHTHPGFARIVPQRIMNSYLRDEYPILLYPWSQYQPGDWILHFAGLPYPRRVELARQLLHEKCSHQNTLNDKCVHCGEIMYV